MTTSTSHEPTIAAPTALAHHPLDLAGRAVLLATDYSPASNAATRFAAALAATHHARVHVLSVIDTSSAPMPLPLGLAFAVTDTAMGTSVREQQAAVLRKKISEVTHEECDWPARVKVGVPAHAIVREAKRIGAVLVILGLQRHGKLDRTLNDETALTVMRSATCPVIGVALDTTELPRRIVAAVDFSATSLQAARAAPAVGGEQTSLMLAYAQPFFATGHDDGETVIHDLGVQAGFERTTVELTRPGLTVEHIVLPHELSLSVPTLLLEYASDTHADLIAAGSAPHTKMDRWMIGSVSTDLVRDGRTSVLIVPPRVGTG